MEDRILYQYAFSSFLQKGIDGDELFLSKYSEVQRKTDAPCFFWGEIRNPFILARCLVTLSNVVKSSFVLSAEVLAKIKDPIITAGNEKIRFEGFSQCAGVYARIDLLSDSLNGEFLDNGTTNVDLNQSTLNALNSIRQNGKLLLSVGKKELQIMTNESKLIEKKVPLPTKWIKGLSTVQIYLSKSELVVSLNRIESQQLIRSIPKGISKIDYYLTLRGNKVVFSPMKSANGILIGGLHRLRLLESLLPYVDNMKVFAHPQMQSTTWQLYFGSIRFSLSLSKETWRGFSGEGATLDNLIENFSPDWLQAMDHYASANQTFNPTEVAITNDISLSKVENLSVQLAAMGLLGFDLDENHFFYRSLPFKPERMLSLHPRINQAQKLITDHLVKIVNQDKEKTEARVKGTEMWNLVIIDDKNERCTCEWYSKHQGERGSCKHIIAVKMILKK